MKKICWILSVLMLIFLAACDDSGGEGGGGGGGGEYAWVLIEQADFEDDLKSLMGSSSPKTTSLQLDTKPGDFGISWVYTGETNESKNIRNGESWSGRCTFSEPPQVINPGDRVTLDLSITETENSLLGRWYVELDPSAYFFYKLGSDPDMPDDPEIQFKDDKGSSYFFVNTNDEDNKPFSKKQISAIAPKGKPGNRITLTFLCQFDDAGTIKMRMRTVYLYEMKKQ